MNQAVRIFRAVEPSGVACEYATSTSHKDIAGLSQVTWPAIQSIFHKKISMYIYTHTHTHTHTHIHTYTHTHACMCVLVCVCELPLRTFYVRSSNNIYAKYEISGFHSVKVSILVFWNRRLSSRVTDSRRFEGTPGINKPDSVNYPEDQNSMHSDVFNFSSKLAIIV